MLRRELGKVASAMDEFLRTDSFPDAVTPPYLASAVRDYPARGGKRLRPAIVLWSCGAAGGDPERAFYAAAALEVFHNWTLVHDDIIDRDDFRRGAPTEHRVLGDFAGNKFGAKPEDALKFGCDFAILAGDVQQAWAFDLMLRSVERGVPDALALALARRLARETNRLLISGEALDVEFALRPVERLTLDEVRSMIQLKTGVLIESAAVTGAAIGCGNDTDARVRAAADALRDAALAFQLRDDELGIYGDEKTFGKPLGSDLREGKPTILLLSALTSPRRNEVLALLERARAGGDVLAEARELFERCGAVALLRREMKQLADASCAKLETLPPGPFRELLLELADYFVTREK